MKCTCPIVPVLLHLVRFIVSCSALHLWPLSSPSSADACFPPLSHTCYTPVTLLLHLVRCHHILLPSTPFALMLCCSADILPFSTNRPATAGRQSAAGLSAPRSAKTRRQQTQCEDANASTSASSTRYRSREALERWVLGLTDGQTQT